VMNPLAKVVGDRVVYRVDEQTTFDSSER
jgi:hypothetical protein